MDRLKGYQVNMLIPSVNVDQMSHVALEEDAPAQILSGEIRRRLMSPDAVISHHYFTESSGFSPYRQRFVALESEDGKTQISILAQLSMGYGNKLLRLNWLAEDPHTIGYVHHLSHPSSIPQVGMQALDDKSYKKIMEKWQISAGFSAFICPVGSWNSMTIEENGAFTNTLAGAHVRPDSMVAAKRHFKNEYPFLDKSFFSDEGTWKGLS